MGPAGKPDAMSFWEDPEFRNQLSMEIPETTPFHENDAVLAKGRERGRGGSKTAETGSARNGRNDRV